MLSRTLGLLLGVGIAAGVFAQGPEPSDADLNARIREEGLQRSQLERIVHHMTDVYGPRLTGSPNLENAGRWAIKTMEGWGLGNGRMEPWNWGHEGWLNERAVGHVVSPVKDRLEFEVLGWTPSTNGTVTRGSLAPKAVHVVGRGRLAAHRSGAERVLQSMAGRVKGRIVLVGAPVPVAVDFTPAPLRTPDEQARARFGNAGAPAGGRRGGGGRGRGGATPEGRLTAQQVSARVAEFLRTNRVALRIFDAARRHGQIAAFNVVGYDSSQTTPTVLMRNEDYGRLARLLADGSAVTLEFTIVNRTYPEGRTAYNATAEIRGTDKADEIVMLGGHLDSWHSATGATDNAIGCAIAMEAVRILRAVGASRAGRFAWRSGAVKNRACSDRAPMSPNEFGTAEAPKPAFHKLSGYWNIDGGTGRIRGATVFGPPEAGRDRLTAACALRGFRRLRRDRDERPQRWRHRQRRVQQRRAARHQCRSGSDRVRDAHPSHEPRHLRTDRVGRRAEGGRDYGVCGLSPGDARRTPAEICVGAMPAAPAARGRGAGQ